MRAIIAYGQRVIRNSTHHESSTVRDISAPTCLGATAAVTAFLTSFAVSSFTTINSTINTINITNITNTRHHMTVCESSSKTKRGNQVTMPPRYGATVPHHVITRALTTHAKDGTNGLRDSVVVSRTKDCPVCKYHHNIYIYITRERKSTL